MRRIRNLVEGVGGFVTFWVALMTGVASLGRELAALYAPAQDVSVWQRSVFWKSVLLTFIVSGIASLILKQREVLAEKRKNEFPEIRGKIEEDFLYLGATAKRLEVTFIPVVVKLVNHRNAEAGIERFELSVTVERKEYQAQNIPTQGMHLKRPPYDEFGLRTNPEGIDEGYKDLFKHRHEPLKRGVPQYGWLLFALKETLIQPNMNCVLRLTVIDVLGGSHTLPEVRRSWKKSGTVSTPIEIDVKSIHHLGAGQSSEAFNESVLTLIIEGRNLLLECEDLNQLTPIDECQKKVNLWILNVESLLRDHKGPKYVDLFRAEAGVPLPFGKFGETSQAKLCHHLRSRLKNLQVLSIPNIRS